MITNRINSSIIIFIHKVNIPIFKNQSYMNNKNLTLT